MKTSQRDSEVSSTDFAQAEPSATLPIARPLAKHLSGLSPAWTDKVLTSVKRMHEDEAFRRTIAQKFS